MGVLRLFIVVSILLISTALGLGSFFTHSWIKYTVTPNATDPEYNAKVGTSYMYHTRGRGLFWNQLDSTSSSASVIKANDASPYFTVIYNLRRHCGKPSAEFMKLTTFMKSSVYLHMGYLGGLVLVVLMVSMSAATRCKSAMGVSLGLLLLAEFAGIAGIVLFHLYTMYEKTTKVKELDGIVRKSWTTFLNDATKESFSYSYGAQIASLITSLISIIIMIAFLAKWPKKKNHGAFERPKWLGSEQGTVIYGGSLDYNTPSDIRQNGQTADIRRHSWSGYWEEPADRQQGRFRNTPIQQYSSYSNLDRVAQSNQRRANLPNTRQHYYTNNPLYPMRY